jgi:hypothetical protein
MRALVLDLRDNPGGLLSAAVDVSRMFIGERKLIVYSKGRPEVARRRDHFAWFAAPYPDLPMVVLVNKGSASASEIVAGALQGYKRAVLIGEETFGKGSVQSIIRLNSTGGETQLRLTIAKYFLPDPNQDGEFRSIHNVGVKPDITLENPAIPGWHVDLILQYRKERRFLDFVDRLWRPALAEILDAMAGGDAELRKDLLELNGFRLKRFLNEPDEKSSEAKDAAARARFARLHALAQRLADEAPFARKVLNTARAAGVKEADEDAEIFEVLPKVRRHYLRRFYEVCKSDYGDTSVYPGFDAFYRGLKVDVPDSLRDSVRHEIRRRILQRVADERGAAFVADMQEDVQLQRAIVELLGKTGQQTGRFKLYRPFAEKFKEEPAKAAAVETPAEVEAR